MLAESKTRRTSRRLADKRTGTMTLCRPGIHDEISAADSPVCPPLPPPYPPPSLTTTMLPPPPPPLPPVIGGPLREKNQFAVRESQFY